MIVFEGGRGGKMVEVESEDCLMIAGDGVPGHRRALQLVPDRPTESPGNALGLTASNRRCSRAISGPRRE